MGYHDLILDRTVRDWVLIPLTVSILLMKLIMQFAHLMMSAPPAATKEDKEIREVESISRSQRLRAHLHYIPEYAWRMRKEYFANKDSGVFFQKTQSKGMQEAMMSDPSFMVDMMKKNLTGLLPQLLMGAWVNYFFSGFVMGKLPFNMTPRFKPMVQAGIDLKSLDTSYFTSLSYYILLLLGSRGAMSLVFRENVVDEMENMRRNQMMGMGTPNPTFDAEAQFKAERNALAAVEHEWFLEGSEARALQVLRASRGAVVKSKTV